MKFSKKSLLSLTLVTVLSFGTACAKKAEVANTTKQNNISTMTKEQLLSFNKEKIYEERMLNTIKELASEKYQGRRAGTEGNTFAMDYIINQFKEIGLTSPKSLPDEYKQAFDFKYSNLNSQPKLALKDSSGKVVKDYTYAVDYVLNGVPQDRPNHNTESSICFPQSLEEMVPQKVKDKAVLIPIEVYGNSYRKWAEGAASAGAAFIVTERKLKESDAAGNVMTIGYLMSNEKNSVPTLQMNSKTFKELRESYKDNMKLEFAYEATLDKDMMLYNVIGAIEGTDETLKNECIIISAHYDHVGTNFTGTYNPGSLDNASGIAVMLELARVMKENEITSKKTILFAAFNAEEILLRGSSYYANDPLYPLRKTTIINLDMVGSAALPTIAIDGTEALEKEFIQFSKDLSLDSILSENQVTSDQQTLIGAGASGIILTNEDMNSGYHTAADTPDKVNKTCLEQFANLVLYYLESGSHMSY